MLRRSLHTLRLVLRPWSLEDAPALFPLAVDPTIGLNAGWNPHKTIEETRVIIESFLVRKNSYAITLQDGTLIGSISADEQDISVLCENEKQVEIGYWIGVPYQRQGFGKEAAEAVIAEAKVRGIELVWASYFPGNIASKALLQSLGFSYVDTQVFTFPQLGIDQAVNVVQKTL